MPSPNHTKTPKTSSRNRARNRFIALCLAPAVILFLAFIFYPTLQIFRMSLYRWGGYSNNREFVGFSNFITLWNDQNFYRSFQNTILLIVVVTIFTVLLAVLFAAILSTEKIKGANFFRVVFYIPNILSIVIISGIFAAIYEPSAGLLNSLLPERLERLWLGDQKIVLFSVAFALIWQAIGYYMVMYMAAMANIPTSLYEAVELDGAGRIGKFVHVTLPLIWHSIRTTLTFFIISTINLSFLLVTILTGGGPDGASEVFLSFMFKRAYTDSTYGYGMAIGVVIFIFSFALSGIISWVTKRDILEY